MEYLWPIVSLIIIVICIVMAIYGYLSHPQKKNWWLFLVISVALLVIVGCSSIVTFCIKFSGLEITINKKEAKLEELEAEIFQKKNEISNLVRDYNNQQKEIALHKWNEKAGLVATMESNQALTQCVNRIDGILHGVFSIENLKKEGFDDRIAEKARKMLFDYQTKMNNRDKMTEKEFVPLKQLIPQVTPSLRPTPP